jgi:hypothetical protein
LTHLVTDVAPLVSRYVPAGQGVQLKGVEKFAVHVPARQRVQAVEPGKEKEPGGQGEQAAASDVRFASGACE